MEWCVAGTEAPVVLNLPLAGSMTQKPSDPSPPVPEGAPDGNVRSIVSLLLFVHVFCLFVALSGNYYLSPLQIRLLNALGPYVQLFKLKPTAPYHLTDASELSDDHFIEVEVTAGAQQGEILRLPESAVRGNSAKRRFNLLAKTMGATSYLGAEQNTAAFARAIGAHALNEGNNQEVVVRCRRYQPQPRQMDPAAAATPADPTAEAYLTTAYEARVWRDRSGQVQLLKIEEKKVVAPLE